MRFDPLDPRPILIDRDTKDVHARLKRIWPPWKAWIGKRISKRRRQHSLGPRAHFNPLANPINAAFRF